MVCTKCGNVLANNAKFCSRCGNVLSTPNVEMGQQQVTMTAPVQQPVYVSNPNMVQQKKSKTKIIVGIVIIVLLIAVIALSVRVIGYENRSAKDKTIDAIESWFEGWE